MSGDANDDGVISDSMHSIIRTQHERVGAGNVEGRGCRGLVRVAKDNTGWAGVKFPENKRLPGWIGHVPVEHDAGVVFEKLIGTCGDRRRAQGTRTFVGASGLDYLEVADTDCRKMVEGRRAETVVRTNRDGKEVSVIRDERSIFLERA